MSSDRLSQAVLVSVGANVVQFPARQSWGKRVDLCSGEVFDLHREGAAFQDRWQGFLRASFPGPVQVASHFAITERGAEKWWHGIGGPRGDKLALALRTLPGAYDALIGPGAARKVAA